MLIFNIYVLLEHIHVNTIYKYNVGSRMGDLVRCILSFKSWVQKLYTWGSKRARKRKFRTFFHLTLISKFYMLSVKDFVVCSTDLHSGVYI